MSLVVDAHQHFWKRDLPFNYEWLKAPGNEAINHDFLPDDLRPLLGAAGVDKSVFVQTQHTIEENRWVLGLVDEHDFIAGVVGWVDLASDDCEDQLAEFKDHPKFVGIRHVTQDEPDDDFIIRPAILDGLKTLERHSIPFDLLFYVKHIKHATTVAQAVPSLPLVIDHLAKPQIKDQVLDNWETHFRAAAKHPNVFCKLSGMVTEADWQNWTADDLRPYVEIALDAFGPQRCMYGSDWPVCVLAGTYGQIHSALRELISELSDTEQQRIWSGTAIEFYGL